MTYSRREGPVPVQGKGVHFAPSLVTSTSRPPNSTEDYAMYSFEIHAQVCRRCNDPYNVYKTGRSLCDNGHEKAVEVAKQVYCSRRGETFSTRGDAQQQVRVELGPGFDHVRSLLRAVERSRRHHHHRPPFVYMGSSYKATPRLPSRPHHAVKVTQPNPPEDKGTKVYQADQWRVDELRHHTPVIVHVSSSKRGSLYEKDIAEQVRRQQSYKVEVRAPRTLRSARYYD